MGSSPTSGTKHNSCKCSSFTSVHSEAYLNRRAYGDSFGDNCRRFGLEEDRIHSLCSLLAHAGQDVSVGPQGRGNVLVSQNFGDNLDGYTVQKCKRGVSVPQVVEVDRRKTGTVTQGLKVGARSGP